MKIYTKTGDQGTTALYGGTRVSKSHMRIDVYGTIDELNSWIGLIRHEVSMSVDQEILLKIQKDLFYIGAELALDPAKKILSNGKNRLKTIINTSQIQFLEKQIDSYDNNLPPLAHFILPGGHKTTSQIHIARTICRKAERITVALSQIEEVRLELIQYLNRLSDYLFTLARKIGHDNHYDETFWLP
ncbi:MAG: cob(I)yrinic acid a,c-diamide adenosyltransferase [Flavobacteriales bacterium]